MKKDTLLYALMAMATFAFMPNIGMAQWLTTGNTGIGAANYLGTQNNAPLRIATNAGATYTNLADLRMIVMQDGSVGIGRGDGTLPPTTPLNKLLVENGFIYDPGSAQGDIYQRLFSISPAFTSELEFGIISASNNDNMNNVAVMGYAQNSTATLNIGTVGYTMDGATNLGAIGAAINGLENIGVRAEAIVNNAVPNTNNTAFSGDVEGDDADDNRGVDVNVSGDNVAGHNVGFGANVSGDNSSHNYGVDIDVTCVTSTGFITGGFFDVNGASAGNVGVNTHVNGGAPYSTGFLCEISGATNQIVGLSVDADGSSSNNSRGVDVDAFSASGQNIGGHFRASNGNYAVGVIGEISTPSSNINYGVYGNHFSFGNNGTDYAGYFNGDVFSSTTFYPSDPKLKENVREYKGALEQLAKLDIKNYTYKAKDFPGMNLPTGEQIGLMATNLKEVFPYLVKQAIYPGSLSGKSDVSFSAVNTNALVPVLIQAVKELDAKTAINEKLNEEVTALKTDNEALKKDMTEMKEMLDKICSNGCGDFKPASTLGGTTGSESGLFQNVPNPFSNTTVIPYTIGQGVKHAVLIITNLNGNELKRFTTSQTGAGTFEVNMDEFGASTYVYSLFTDGKLIDTKKMVLAGK